jgi:L-lactate dehydrogenase
MKKGSKVAIIGAGFVGASAAYAMAINQLCNELVLIDVNREKAIGEADDISHALAFLGQMDIYAGDYSDVKDCDVIIVTAGANRKPGETRLDLARKNVAIAKDITANIMKHYNTGVILVVANPVDILTYMITKWSGLPKGRVLGTGTVLDSLRFRYLLSRKFDVDVKNIHGYMIGEHGDSQIPAWSATHIAGLSIEEYCVTSGIAFTDEERAAIIENTKKAGANIIKNKGATYYAIGITINTIVETLLKNQNTIRTVGSVIDGPHGIHDVVLSLPSVISSRGVEKVLELKLTEKELEGLKASAEAVRLVLDEVKDL